MVLNLTVREMRVTSVCPHRFMQYTPQLPNQTSLGGIKSSLTFNTLLMDFSLGTL